MKLTALRHISSDSPSISSDMLNSAALEAFAPERCCAHYVISSSLKAPSRRHQRIA